MRDEIQLGTVVTDRKDDSETTGLVVEVLAQHAADYVTHSGGPAGADITLADHNEDCPPDDPVAMVVFDPILRRNDSDWQENPMGVISNYRQGAFRSVVIALPASRLNPVGDDDNDDDGLEAPA